MWNDNSNMNSYCTNEKGDLSYSIKHYSHQGIAVQLEKNVVQDIRC